jgi:hypothetical protein
MPKFLRILVLALLAAAPLAACGRYESDIVTVKAAKTLTDQTNEAVAMQIAGARGKVTWSAERPEKYKDNEFIVGVNATIEKTTREGAKRVVVLQFVNNRQTKQVGFDGLTIDGRRQDIIGGALNLLLMQLE